MSKYSMFPITLNGDDVQQKRKEIKEYFHNTFNLFEKIFEVLIDDTVFYQKSEITRHPMIFYFGHTATFFINKLINMNIINTRINPDFESIFAVGVDEMSWDDIDSNNYKWPKVDDVRRYRTKVKSLVDSLIDSLPLTLPIAQDSEMWIILMGIEHERIHVETSLVLHRQMPIKMIQDVNDLKIHIEYTNVVQNKMIDIEATKITLGKLTDENYYGWDNEYGTFSKDVDKFQVSKYLVSNSEYMEFIKDTSAPLPPFWVLVDGQYMYRTLTSIVPMPLSYPVDVNALEAEAFCEYKSKKDGLKYSLPSESEYKAICEHANIGHIDVVDDDKANHNLIQFSACAVDKHDFNGIYDVVGNVWQWSSTAIFGFEGFKVHKAYDDFSIPTFDNQHALILGSSWASSGNLIMKNSRYAFRKHFYQHAGFRYVISNKKEENLLNSYETDDLILTCCESQYQDNSIEVENIFKEYVNIVVQYSINTTKALDLGCTTGRTTFELAKTFDNVEGIDLSARFIQIGSKLKDEGYILFNNSKITLDELGYTKIKDKVSFWQADICNLKPNFHSYDMVVMTNLMDRLYHPESLLDTIDTRVNEDGILLVISPLSCKKNVNIQDILAHKFELLETKEINIKSQITIWRKK